MLVKEEDLPDGEMMTCNIPMGSVLFISQLIPHCSTENLSNRIRWSFDFRWQRPDELSVMQKTDCILMRTGKDPGYQVQWPGWTQKGRENIVALESGESDRCIDANVDGPWLRRWGN